MSQNEVSALAQSLGYTVGFGAMGPTLQKQGATQKVPLDNLDDVADVLTAIKSQKRWGSD